MTYVTRILILVVVLAISGVGNALAATVDGVITSYESGNQGTDMTVRTSDGRRHAMWFDNMKKPSFEGRQLPWCPEFPCSGWPRQIVIGRTRVRVYTYTHVVDGATVVTPTKIELLH